MKTALLASASALFLTACAVIPPANPPTPPLGEGYRAIGTEPGWTVMIGEDRIEYLGDYGQTKIITPHPAPRTTFNGHRYEAKTEAHSLVVDVTHGKCSDGMSDRIYADTVMVIADGKTVNGCGGAILPPDELAGSNWRIERIADMPMTSGRVAHIDFGVDRISGSSGCNRFSGSYTRAGDVLTLGPIESTEMACLGAGMTQEQSLFAILGGALSLRFTDGDTLVLTGEGGKEIRLKRAI